MNIIKSHFKPIKHDMRTTCDEKRTAAKFRRQQDSGTVPQSNQIEQYSCSSCCHKDRGVDGVQDVHCRLQRGTLNADADFNPFQNPAAHGQNQSGKAQQKNRNRSPGNFLQKLAHRCERECTVSTSTQSSRHARQLANQ